MKGLGIARRRACHRASLAAVGLLAGTAAAAAGIGDVVEAVGDAELLQQRRRVAAGRGQAQLQAGRIVFENPAPEWAVLSGLWTAKDRPLPFPTGWAFEPSGTGERIPIAGRGDVSTALRCPKCEFLIFSSVDSTRQEMVKRWKALTGEPDG